MENGGTKYNVVLMVPWAVDKSAAGSQTDWDVIWTGFSPTVQDYSETMEYYLSKGEEIDSIYNGMRSFNTRSMAMGRTIFQGTAPSGKTGVALFRTCSLNKNKTLENAESAMIGMASALKKISQGSSHIWMPGPGSTQAQQGTFFRCVNSLQSALGQNLSLPTETETSQKKSGPPEPLQTVLL